MNNSIRSIIKNRYYLHLYLRPFCNENLKYRLQYAENTIAVYTQPRSGSTWLAEILRHIPKGLILNEPLWRGFLRTNGERPGKTDGRLNETRKLDFYYNQPIPEIGNWPEAELFFERLFRGGIPKLGLYKMNSLKELKSKDIFIYKFCYGNLMFHWHLAHFKIKPIVLIRHPCAVIASQLRHEGFRHVLENPQFRLPEFRFWNYFEPYLNLLNSLKNAEEILAAIWAINIKAIYAPHLHNQSWYNLSYEKLFLNPKEEVEMLFSFLEQPVPDRLNTNLNTPSITSSAQSIEMLKIRRNPHLHLEKWKEALSHKQINNIMQVVNEIGVDFYSSEDPMPNLDKFPS